MEPSESVMSSTGQSQKTKPALSYGSALWQRFAARYREEHGKPPDPGDRDTCILFDWFGWGANVREMGWLQQVGPHPLMDCPKCGKFRGHDHRCVPTTNNNK